MGYKGALYAWESADTGEETTPERVPLLFAENTRVRSIMAASKDPSLLERDQRFESAFLRQRVGPTFGS